MEKTKGQLYTELENRMRQYSGFGAMDTEGRYAVSMVESAMRDGKPFPLKGDNPWQLYESVPGWEQASAELTRAARAWFDAAMIERFGLPQHTEGDYGVLVAESLDRGGFGLKDYQIIGAVSSPDEARELMRGYIKDGPEHDCLTPDQFRIQRRDEHGFYTVRESID